MRLINCLIVFLLSILSVNVNNDIYARSYCLMDGNLSTPYDISLLMSYCLNNLLFKEISSIKYYKTHLKG